MRGLPPSCFEAVMWLDLGFLGGGGVIIRCYCQEAVVPAIGVEFAKDSTVFVEWLYLFAVLEVYQGSVDVCYPCKSSSSTTNCHLFSHAFVEFNLLACVMDLLGDERV